MDKNISLWFAALSVFVVTTSLVVEKADGATYIVGDTIGWRIPSGADAYKAWASRHTFRVEDVIVFNFSTGMDDVAPVRKEAYDACNSSSVILLLTVGPANVTLTTPGQEYFISTFGQRCLAGQKLAVNVTASSSLSPSAPPTATITPPSSSPPSSSMSPSGRPAVPPSSGMSPSGEPAMPPSSSMGPIGGPGMAPSSNMSPSGGPGMAPSSDMSPSGGPGMAPSPEDSAAPGSQASDDGNGPPPPSGATRKDVATMIVTMIISTAVGYMF